MSRFHFQRVFRAVTGLTPKAYAQAHRATLGREHLCRSATVTDAIYEAGFNSNGRFYATADRMLGMTPTDFREGGSNVEIRFAIGETSLGAVLVAASDKGVCSILFGDDPKALAHDLQDRFPKARLVGGDRSFEEVGGEGRRIRRDPAPRPRSAPGHPRHRLRAPGLEGAAGDPDRIDAQLFGRGEEDRSAGQRARGGSGLRRESAGRCHPVSPRGEKRRRRLGLPVGSGAFFDEDSNPANGVAEVMNFLTQIQANRVLTDRVCALLQHHGLIQPWPLKVQEAGGERVVEGLYRIDVAALNALPADVFSALRDGGALPLAYCQLLSMQHLARLAPLAQAHAQAQAQATQPLPQTPAGDLDLEFLNRGGTISFGNLL